MQRVMALLLAGILLFSAAAERPQPTLAQTERRAVIRVAGDFVIHDALIRSAQALGGGEAYEFSPMLSEIRAALSNADFTFANVDGALSGIVGGHEVVDFGVDLIDGSYHDVDSSEMAFKIAGSMAFKEALQRANCALLEPMMKVEVVVPDEYMGDVMGDISARRGRVTGMDAHAGMHSIDGIVPLSEMFGYATDLRSKTQGRGTYTMQFEHYEEVPAGIADKILGKR